MSEVSYEEYRNEWRKIRETSIIGGSSLKEFKLIARLFKFKLLIAVSENNFTSRPSSHKFPSKWLRAVNEELERRLIENILLTDKGIDDE